MPTGFKSVYLLVISKTVPNTWVLINSSWVAIASMKKVCVCEGGGLGGGGMRYTRNGV